MKKTHCIQRSSCIIYWRGKRYERLCQLRWVTIDLKQAEVRNTQRIFCGCLTYLCHIAPSLIISLVKSGPVKVSSSAPIHLQISCNVASQLSIYMEFQTSHRQTHSSLHNFTMHTQAFYRCVLGGGGFYHYKWLAKRAFSRFK